MRCTIPKCSDPEEFTQARICPLLSVFCHPAPETRTANIILDTVDHQQAQCKLYHLEESDYALPRTTNLVLTHVLGGGICSTKLGDTEDHCTSLRGARLLHGVYCPSCGPRLDQGLTFGFQASHCSSSLQRVRNWAS